MKKYNVYELYVVGVKEYSNDYYLICKHDSLSEFYKEIFTNKKINAKDTYSIEQLCDYYSVFSQCNYVIGQPLMLTTSDLITKYIDINNYKNDKEKRY